MHTILPTPLEKAGLGERSFFCVCVLFLLLFFYLPLLHRIVNQHTVTALRADRSE